MKPNSKILIVGPTGGVGSVATQVLREQFPELTIIGASRDLSKYERLNSLLKRPIEFYKLDASDIGQVRDLLEETRAGLLVNTGLPYYNLSLMEACRQARVNYLDTACYEPKRPKDWIPRYRHKEQWGYNEAFKKAKIIGVVGCGFDPGVTGAWVRDALDREFSEVHSIDILDCNGGDHGKFFRTNFNFVINMSEFANRSRYYQRRKWVYVPSLDAPDAVHQSFEFEKIGQRELYLIYHEEIESLVKNFPQIGRIRFWMTFGKQYIYCYGAFGELGLRSIKPVRLVSNSISPLAFLRSIVPDQELIKKYRELLVQIGMLSESPIELDVKEISPLGFVQKVLPDPAGLAAGFTNISAIIEGIGKDGKPKRYRRGQICDNADCNKNWKANAVSGTTGVPAAAGAAMILRGKWRSPGVFNVENLKPIPFLDEVQKHLPMWEQFGDKVPKLKI